MKRYDFRITKNGDYGWYITIIDSAGRDYIHKDLQIHFGTGYIESGCLKHGKAPGYYPSREIAEVYLRIYLNKKEKHNMADKIEINVKVNGKDVPLHKVSEQTLLTIRENSKPKPVLAFQVCGTIDGSGPRLIFKMPDGDINYLAGKYVALDSNNSICNYNKSMGGLWCSNIYSNLRELKLEDL